MSNKARKLYDKIEKVIKNDDMEKQKISGVKCSRADLEMLEMLLKYYIGHGDFGNFMIYGEVKEVLQKNDLV